MKQIITLSLIIGFLMPVQSQSLYRYTFQEPHMGTYFKIIMYAEDRQLAINTAEAAYDTVAALNMVLSDYLAESQVSQVNNAPAKEDLKISPALYAAIQESLEISEMTRGAFDITVGPVVHLWRKARKENELPGKLSLKTAKEAVGYNNLCLNDGILVKQKTGMKLDFGGIGKGMALKAALQVINEAGITRVLLDAGGDLLLGEAPPQKEGWEIVIGLFEQKEKFQRKLRLANTAVAGSGDLYQFIELDGKRYSHIVDPATGLGTTGQKRSTVIGPDAATADALASALCVMNTRKARALLKKLPDYQALVFITNSNEKINIALGENLLK